VAEQVTKTRALVVEDDPNIVDLIRSNLAVRGFDTVVSADGARALQLLDTEQPDIVLLDLMLPEADGFELCRLMRERSGVAIIVVSARGGERDKVTALNMGADDYLTKPFSPRVLLARIKALLRRKPKDAGGEGGTIRVRQLIIHPGRHEVLLNGEALDLTYTEFKLLHFLARKPGWAFTRGQIVDAVKGEDYPVTERSVDVQVVGLRKKLGDFGANIETVRGVGYRFKE
jgi:two-component system, OmpR family, alkaline phosphatase synthesis response regulator PhoP